MNRETMTMRAKMALMGALCCAALLGGCGGDTYVTQVGSTSISKGQELTDLQRALSEGAITQPEFEELRQKIMRRPN